MFLKDDIFKRLIEYLGPWGPIGLIALVDLVAVVFLIEFGVAAFQTMAFGLLLFLAFGFFYDRFERQKTRRMEISVEKSREETRRLSLDLVKDILPSLPASKALEPLGLPHQQGVETFEQNSKTKTK